MKVLEDEFPFQTGDVQVPCSFSIVFQSVGEKLTCKHNPTEIQAPQGNKNKQCVAFEQLMV